MSPPTAWPEHVELRWDRAGERGGGTACQSPLSGRAEKSLGALEAAGQVSQGLVQLCQVSTQLVVLGDRRRVARLVIVRLHVSMRGFRLAFQYLHDAESRRRLAAQ